MRVAGPGPRSGARPGARLGAAPGLGGATSAGSSAAAPPGAGFSVAPGPTEAGAGSIAGPAAPTATASAAATSAATGLDGLLGVQETAAESVRDRAARRHGRALLALLDSLHRDLLAGGGESPAGLAALLQTQPPADDPRLAAVLRAIATRAAVELARRGWEDPPRHG